MDKEKKVSVEELRRSLGVTAEMSLIFMRAAIGAGATIEEAAKLTQAYIAALLFGNQKGQRQPEGE